MHISLGPGLPEQHSFSPSELCWDKVYRPASRGRGQWRTGMSPTLVENLATRQEDHWCPPPQPPLWQQPYYLDLHIWGPGQEGRPGKQAVREDQEGLK